MRQANAANPRRTTDDYVTDIESITSANLSLMPDELEKTMTKQDLRDVIGFLNGVGK